MLSAGPVFSVPTVKTSGGGALLHLYHHQHQIDRQTDRQDRKIDKIDRQTDRLTDRQIDEFDRQTDHQTDDTIYVNTFGHRVVERKIEKLGWLYIVVAFLGTKVKSTQYFSVCSQFIFEGQETKKGKETTKEKGGFLEAAQ